jgi:hypothetical protein
MSKLVIALLNEDNQLEKFEEFDMSWVEQFNSEFKKNEGPVPFVKDIYEEEMVEMTSFAVLNGLVLTENDEQFRVDRSPLKLILRKLFGYEVPAQNLPEGTQ